MHEQQQALKAEYSALKQQIAEIVKVQQNNLSSKRTPPTAAARHVSESDIPMTSSDLDSPWIPVRNRRRRKSLPNSQTNSKDAYNQAPRKPWTQNTLRYDSRESGDLHYEHRMHRNRESRWHHGHDNPRKSRNLNPRLTKSFFVTRLTKGGCYNPLPRFSKPNPL